MFALLSSRRASTSFYSSSLICEICEICVFMLLTLTGKIGGRTDSAFQPNRNSVAAPQILPWHGPIPQRVCNLAARQESLARKRSNVTSSQRQTIVSALASFFNSGRSRNVISNVVANLRCFERYENNSRATLFFSHAASPAISPSTSDNSNPPIPVTSPWLPKAKTKNLR